MTIKVNPDWWKSIFDEVYLLTDARSVCNEDITRKEVDIICSLLPVQPEQSILDLCGGHGRHSLELCSRGFSGITLVDHSQYLVNHARTIAGEKKLLINAVRCDARDTGLLSESFEALTCPIYWMSFGEFLILFFS